MIDSDSYSLIPKMLGFDSEIVRLRDQAEISWEYEYRVLSRNGLLESTQLLEAGSGPGFITRKLAECLPRTRITALDTNSHMLDFAKLSIPEKLLDRIAFLNNSIYSFDIQPEQFDFILARLVFQHLEDPISAAKNALRLLRNNGKLAIIDVDASLWGVSEPYIPELTEIYQKATLSQKSRGGNQYIGRRMQSILREAGFVNVHLESFIYTSDELGIEPFLSQLSPARLVPALISRHITPRELAAAYDGFSAFLSAPDKFVLMMGFIAFGERIHGN